MVKVITATSMPPNNIPGLQEWVGIKTGALTSTAIAAALKAKNLTDAQARNVIANAPTLVDGLNQVGLTILPTGEVIVTPTPSPTPTPTPAPTPTPTAPRVLYGAIAGSSTPQNYGTDGNGTTVASATRSTTGTSFEAMGTSGLGILTFAKIIAERTGLAAKYLMKGQGGSTVRDWIDPNSSLRAGLVAGIKAMGACDFILWACGFNDAYQNIVDSEASHLANLRKFFQQVRDETGMPNIKFILGGTQLYTGTNGVGSDDKWAAVRSAELTVAGDPNIYFGAHSFDLPQIGDGIHLVGSAYATHATRWAENTLAALGLGGAVAETGPKVLSVRALYDTKSRIKLQHSSGNDFTPDTSISGFLVSFDNGVTFSLANTAVRVDATTIDITHPSSGGAAPTVYAFYGKAPERSAILHDNSARVLPLNPTMRSGVKAPSGTSATDPAVVTPTPTPTPTPGATVTKTALIAFSENNPAPTTAYNVFHLLPEVKGTTNASVNTSTAIKLDDGTATNWVLKAVNAFQAGNNTQGTTGGTYPDAAMLGYIYTGQSVNGDNGGVNTASTTLRLSGLNKNNKYSFEVFSARSAPDRKTSIKIGTAAAQVVDSGNNKTTMVTFTDLVPDADGNIDIVFGPAANYSYGYLNILKITETSTSSGSPDPTVYRVNHLDDGGANGVFYGSNSGPAASYYADLDETHVGIQRYDYSTGAARKVNTNLIYKHGTREAILGGAIMEDTGLITGTADHHGVHAGARWKNKFMYGFGGVHNAPMKVSLSTDNGRTWTAQPEIGTSMCYPHPVVTADNLLMWMRQAGSGNYPLVFYQGIVNETSGVVTWGSMIKFIDLGQDTRVYLGEPFEYNGLIYLPWCRANATDEIRQDFYLGVYDPIAKTFRNLAGTVMYTLAQLPVLRTEADASFRLVNQTDVGNQSNTPTIVVDAEGVHVTYQDGPEALSHTYARYSHAGALVEGPFVVGTAPYRYSTPNMIPTPQGKQVFYPSPEGSPLDMDTKAVFERGGSIWKRTRISANNWSAPELVHVCTPVHPLDSVCRVKDAKADLRVFWAERAILDKDYTTGGNLRTYGFGDNGFVTTPMGRDTDAATFVGSVAYTDAEFQPLHNLFRTLKHIGALPVTDYLVPLGELNESLSLRSIVNGYVVTKTGPRVTHVPGKGWKSTGDKLELNFNPTQATNKKMSLSATTLAIYPTEDTQEATSDMGSTDTTNVTFTLGSRSNSNNASTRLGDANGAPTRPVTYADMLIMSQRIGGTKRIYTRAKDQVSQGNVAATRFPDGNITILGNGTAVTTRGNGIAFGGGSIDVGPLAQAFKRYAYERMGKGA